MGRLWEIVWKLITNQLRVGQLRAKLSIPVNTNLKKMSKKKFKNNLRQLYLKVYSQDPIVLKYADNGKAQSAYDEISSSKSATLQNQITDFGTLKKILLVK
ncbi:hypothetical protein [Lactococcus lactis]